MLRKILKVYLRFISVVVIKRYHPIIIGVTGNTGKTTTKEAVFCVLNISFPEKVRKTEDNLNTDIGVPISVLGLNNAEGNIGGWLRNIIKTFKILTIGDKNFPKYLVLELAADRPGEIEYFTKFLPTKIGVVTTIGKDPVHLEFFPNRDKLIDEKSWLVRGVQQKGTVILNKDDKDVIAMGKLAKDKTKILSYGKTPNSDLLILEHRSFFAKDAKFYTEAKFKFQNQIYRLKLPDAIGKGNLYSAMPALLCGFVSGVSIKDGIKALQQEVFLPPGRMKIIKGLKGATIIDDTYNASPLSYYNALATIADIDMGKGRKILIMGDMAELGKRSLDIHKEILKKALNFADIIICLGEQMTLGLTKLGSVKLPKINIAKNHQDAINVTKRLAREGDVILVKGAQVMRMEKIVKALMKSPKQAKELLVRQEKYWINS